METDLRRWMRLVETTLTEGLASFTPAELIAEAAPTLDDYLSRGIDPEFAPRYLQAKIPLANALAYERGRARYPETSFREIQSDYTTKQRHKREDRADTKLIASLPQLAAANTPITHEQACAIIANDDQMFDAINMHISGDPDYFENDPEAARTMLALIHRVRPIKHSPLYRGECTTRYGGEHGRGFHSWTVARDTADYFWHDCPRQTGRLLMLTAPVKGIDLGRVGQWRGRLKGESHYMGSQGEWLVPDGYPSKVIAER